MNSSTLSILIDPASEHYSGNKLFDLSDLALNRDGTLLPFYRLKALLNSKNIDINTADLIFNQNIQPKSKRYFSLGMLRNIPLAKDEGVIFKAFLIMEPPIVAPELYDALPVLTSLFEEVYVHNVSGDGYSLAGVNQSKLRKLYWPQPYWGALDQFWSRVDRLNRVVVINGNHKPKTLNQELYSKRIKAMVGLSKFNVIDLYGRGWRRWWARSSFWTPYWFNRRVLMSIYKGECVSKYEILSKYSYCLCFENMEMKGYVSEKIFDCLYAGTIPIYWGAPDIEFLVPPDVFIDARKFSTWDEMWTSISSMSSDDISRIRHAGRLYLESENFMKHYHSLEYIVDR